MLHKHRRLETMIHFSLDGTESPNCEEFFSSSEDSSMTEEFLRGWAAGSVYVQACKLCPRENYSTDFESSSSSGVEVLISELDRIEDSYVREDTYEVLTLIQDINLQYQHRQDTRELEKQKIKQFLLLAIQGIPGE